MSKITSETIQYRAENNQNSLLIYSQWYKVNESLVKFQNKATIKTFEYLFEEQAERLWRHFTADCKRQFIPFLTYLTEEQKYELIVNANENIQIYI